MSMIQLYFYDDNVDIVEQGDFAIHQLDALLNERLTNSKLPFESAEKTISLTSFGLYRDDEDGVKDCVDVQILANGLFNIQTDKLYPVVNNTSPTGFFNKIKKSLRLGLPKIVNACEVDFATAKGILQDYLSLDRKSFENKHQNTLWKMIF